MPLEASAEPRDGGDLYLVGGYNSIDAGTVPWGGIVESENLYVGDRAGEVVIVYEDGSRDEVPLVFGCTNAGSGAHWLDGGAPFKTDRAEPEMTACLREALCLKDAFEGEPQCVLKIRLRNEPVREIFVRDIPTSGASLFSRAVIWFPRGLAGRFRAAFRYRPTIPFSIRMRSTAGAPTCGPTASNVSSAVSIRSATTAAACRLSSIPRSMLWRESSLRETATRMS